MDPLIGWNCITPFTGFIEVSLHRLQRDVVIQPLSVGDLLS
jgi:hypothetical protein